MRNNLKKWMAYLFVAFLLLGVFPLLSTSTGAQAGDARADEIGIKGIYIVNATNVSIDETPDGVIATGNWNILVEYNLTENMDLWVLYNISRADSWAYTRTNSTLGNVALGEDIACNNGTFNFAAGEYWVNVTIGNESGPSVNSTGGTLFEFGDVSEVEVSDVGIMGFTDFVNGYYANESHEIAIDTSNMGNQNLTQTTWITLNITNATNSDTLLEIFTIEWLDVGETVTNFTDWVPGYSALYTINVTYSNEGLNGNASMYYDEFTETIQNVSAYDPVFAHTAQVNETSGWTGNATVDVTNDGNIAETFTFHFWVVDDADIIVHDSEMTTSLLSPGANELLMYNYVGLTAGTYTLNVTEPDGSNNTANIVVDQINNPPLLADLSVLPATIYVDDVLTFSVNYTDGNDDAPAYLKCYIGATWNATTEMFDGGLENFTLTETNATDVDHTDAKMFSGTWTAVLGAYTYAFVTSDGTDVSKLEPVGNDFDVLAKQFAPTLTDNTGALAPTTIDAVVFKALYTDANNDTGAVKIKIDTYNTTALNQTNWTWDEGTWEVMVFNATGLTYIDGVNYTYTKTFAEVGTYRYQFKVTDAVKGDVTTALVEFNVTKYVAPDLTGELGGFVVDATGPVIKDAKVSIVIYTETTTLENVSGNMTNVTVRTYANLTATTDANGTFLIAGIAAGKWTVTVTATGYEPHTEDITFTTALLEKNFTLTAIVTEYTLSGTVTPVNATVKVDGTAVTVTNGTYSIKLTKGIHKVTATFTGYDDFSEDVNLTADKTLNIVMTETVVLEYTILLGPFYGDDGILDLLEGVEVTIKVGNDTWTKKTDILGFATFEKMPWAVIPADAKVTATYKGETYDIDPTASDYGHLKGADDDSSLLWLWILIIVVVIIIIIVVIVMKKKPKEAPVDLEEEEMEEGLGEDYDEDMDDLEEEEDFGEFEGEMDDDEMDGVDDLAEELEEFDEEEEFEDEDFGDYEEDMDDEFGDDEFDDEDFDDDEFDDDEFDDDEFDDDF